ncbi:IS200/IS605 family transposase [Candidatus Micrarchaeota archaeon]|nr:IS200/IS605 family transposase [Candidatus Micrarchaeota archaeon]
MSELVRASHSCSQMVFHLEWCTKYRHQVFSDGKYKTSCEAALITAAERHKIILLEFSVMPDHIHVVVQIPLSMSASQALQFLKGYTSYVLLKLYPELRENYFWGCPGVWSPGKFVRTVGDVDLDKTLDYVRNQPMHHQLAAQAAGFSQQ